MKDKIKKILDNEWVQSFLFILPVAVMIVSLLGISVNIIGTFINDVQSEKGYEFYFEKYCTIKNNEPKICVEAKTVEAFNSTLLSQKQMQEIKEFVKNYLEEERIKEENKMQELKNRIQNYKIDE
ncbi:hypothetical protein [Campylobacter corcagiensis]|uniref:Uncharacterized protein n=1 Tax=Campylobacter corcagiensis TaxID=1448857 RepID=A0A7M1LDZ4_9BACT|nr:hypothetical protein [Campylobacter corcagiensis]QKF65177.1 hypothetical protein CCORG_1334 [Campylobacter corcagiensis]QOQ86680.1 hypothetical protein IMC76_05485 [Campylobacter corcagiensis]